MFLQQNGYEDRNAEEVLSSRFLKKKKSKSDRYPGSFRVVTYVNADRGAKIQIVIHLTEASLHEFHTNLTPVWLLSCLLTNCLLSLPPPFQMTDFDLRCCQNGFNGIRFVSVAGARADALQGTYHVLFLFVDTVLVCGGLISGS